MVSTTTITSEMTFSHAVLFAAPIVASLVGAFFWYKDYTSSRNPRRLPTAPGPKKHWLLGNILDMPRSGAPWLAFTDMYKKFGEPPFPFFLLVELS